MWPLAGRCWALTHLPLAVVYVLVFVVSVFVVIWTLKRSRHTSPTKILKAPVLGAASNSCLNVASARFRYISEGYNMIFEGHRRNPGIIYRLPVEQDMLLLPAKYIDELKNQPDSVLSSTHAVSDYFLGAYTTLDISLFGRVVWDALRKHLSRQLGPLEGPLATECNFGFSQELQLYQDWTPILVHRAILYIVARMNARIFVGERLCRNAEWLKISTDFSTCIFMGSSYLKAVPKILRPVVALMIPQLRRICSHRQNAKNILVPEIEIRHKINAKNPQDPSKTPRDMLQWLQEASSGEDLKPERLVDRQLGLSFAATHGTTNLIVNVIYDLAARWNQYASELRQEIENNLEQEGGILRNVTPSTFSKLDSFIKESQRTNPGSAISFNRKLLQPHLLSDGQLLQKSTYVAIASGAMAMSEEYHSSPEIFDGFRFHKLRVASCQNPQFFTSTSFGSLMFGYGTLACPGRHFADLEIKMILIHILLLYDLALDEIVERPRNIHFADANIADPKIKIKFRKREAPA